MENNISNQGNNNIIIQGITDSSITLEVNGATQEIQNEMAELNALMEQMNAQQIQMADKVYDLAQLGQADLGLKKTFNVLMTKRLMEALAANELAPAQKFLAKTESIKKWESDNRFSDVAKNLITFAFVGVLGIQLRKIMAIGKESISAHKQQNYIENCYLIAQKSLQLLNFCLISAFWDAQKSGSYALSEDEASQFARFFDDSIERDLSGYTNFLVMLVGLFQKHNLELPLLELKEINLEKLLKTCQRIQHFNTLLEQSQHSLMTCFEIEGQLTKLLEQLVFLINYNMLSVKSIAYEEQRTSVPQYVHNYVELGIDQKFNENTEKIHIIGQPVVTDAVLLYDKRNTYDKHINLSPFVIDYNTQIFERGVKICFFSCKHISDASLNYRFIEDNTIQNIEPQGLLSPDAKIEELMKDRDNHIKIKFDTIIQQFNEAKKQILNQQSGAADNIGFDDLFE